MLLKVVYSRIHLTIGTIGQKAGFTETLDTQIRKILNTTGTALKAVAVRNKPHPEKGQPQLRDEDFLEVLLLPTFEEADCKQNPQHRPVVVIDHFLHKAENASAIYDNIARWATALIEGNIAHVIFLTTDVGYAKSLASDRVLRTVVLGDKDPDSAKAYVLRHLEYIEGERNKVEATHGTNGSLIAKEQSFELDNAMRILGGRMNDLEGLAQRLAMGVAPDGTKPFKHNAN